MFLQQHLRFPLVLYRTAATHSHHNSVQKSPFWKSLARPSLAPLSGQNFRGGVRVWITSLCRLTDFEWKKLTRKYLTKNAVVSQRKILTPEVWGKNAYPNKIILTTPAPAQKSNGRPLWQLSKPTQEPTKVLWTKDRVGVWYRANFVTGNYPPARSWAYAATVSQGEGEMGGGGRGEAGKREHRVLRLSPADDCFPG